MGSSSMVAVVIVGVLLALVYKGHARLLESTDTDTGTGGGAVANATTGRLSQNFIPYHYNVELTPDIYQDTPPFPFSGSVQIYFTCEVASNVVTINSRWLAIDNSSVKISLVPGQNEVLSDPILNNWSVDNQSEFLHFETTEPLTPRVSYILEMNFNGNISDIEYGLYYDQYNTSDGIVKYIATTQFEAHGGRQAFPGFDEPDFKATFNMTIVRKPPAVSAGNAPLLDTIDRGDGWVADVYATTPKMSLYLVAFGVGELQKLSAGRDNGYEINVWARPEIVSQMNWFLRSAPAIQAWLERETGITYREEKSDNLVVPNKGGAMENWGLMIYAEQYTAYNSETSSAIGKQNIAMIQSHEMAHLWYGDLVTCKWWDDIWLNEGFATYYNYRPTQALGWEGSEAAQVDTQYFMEDDQRNSSDPVRKSIPTVWDSGTAFSGSTYPKGAAIIRMLESILTTPTFKAGMTKHLLKHQYKTVTTDDLWKTLNEQAAIDGIKNPDGSPLDLKLRMDPWLNQMGFPLVSVTRKVDGTATLMRTRFLRPPYQNITTPSPYNYEWDVPITIVSAESAPEAWDAAPSAWIDIGVSITTVSGFPTDLNKWALINAKFAGYYRVMYDNVSQAAIVSQLLLDHTVIQVESRSQIIDDAFSVARARYFPETLAMETTRYLASEEKWGPWNAALRHLKYSDRLIRKQPWSGLMGTYILGLTVPVYNRLGWSYSDTETPFQQFVRSAMISVSCSYGHAECLAEARSQYAHIIPNPSANVVDPNNLPTVLCVGVREGTEADWQMSFDQYLARKTSQIMEERYAYLYGCSCTNDTNLLDRLLVKLNSSVATRDRSILGNYLSQSDYGAQILWDYLDFNWDNLSTLTPGLDGMALLRNIAIGFSTQVELDKLLAFKSNHPKSDGKNASYTNLILDIENNLRWSEFQRPGLHQWLVDHQPSSAMRVKREIGGHYGMPTSSIDQWRGVHGRYRSQANHF